MKKHAIISILLLMLLLIPVVVYASPFFSSGLTKSFGGRVLTTTVPLVTCTGSGTGPVVLTKVNGIPYYTESSTKSPKIGDWILGRVNIIPNFSTCSIQVAAYKIPFPVRTTNDYNISGNSF